MTEHNAPDEASDEDPDARRRSYAILIGIDDADKPGSGEKPMALPTLPLDIARLTLLLRAHGFTILATTAAPQHLRQALRDGVCPEKRSVEAVWTMKPPARAKFPSTSADSNSAPVTFAAPLDAEAEAVVDELKSDKAFEAPPQTARKLEEILDKATRRRAGKRLVVYISGHASAPPDATLLLQHGHDKRKLADISGQLYEYASKHTQAHEHSLVILVTCFSGAALRIATARAWAPEPGADEENRAGNRWTYGLLVPSTATERTHFTKDKTIDFTRYVTELLCGASPREPLVKGGKIPRDLSLSRDIEQLMKRQRKEHLQYLSLGLKHVSVERQSAASPNRTLTFTFPWSAFSFDALLAAAEGGYVDEDMVTTLRSIVRLLWNPCWFPAEITGVLRKMALRILESRPQTPAGVLPLAYEILHLLVHRFNDAEGELLRTWTLAAKTIRARLESTDGELFVHTRLSLGGQYVTNAYFKLFDPAHTSSSEDEERPVSGVSLASARRFAAWCRKDLPEGERAKLLIKYDQLDIMRKCVTHEDFKLFDPAHIVPTGDERRPVHMVSFDSALAFGRWLRGRLVSQNEMYQFARHLQLFQKSPRISKEFPGEWLDPEGGRRRPWMDTPPHAPFFHAKFKRGTEDVVNTKESALITFRIAWDRSTDC